MSCIIFITDEECWVVRECGRRREFEFRARPFQQVQP